MATKDASKAPFGETIAAAYATDGSAVELGFGVHAGTPAAEAGVRAPLQTVNRHGVVAGRDKPRPVCFLDEAHLLFDGASNAFVERSALGWGL